MVSFAKIQFDLEENIPDHMLMFGKQFKILNQKLNSLLQLQANAGSRNSVSGIEVDVILKAQVVKLDHNYSVLNTKVDIVPAAVTKVVEFHSFLRTKIDKKSEYDSQSFAKLEELLGSLKELLSKLGSSLQSSISPDSFSHMFSSLESTLKAALDPLLKMINLLPTGAPLVRTGVQGGKRVLEGKEI
ncbi:unnamed protein product [Lactuca saligna]|uniref:Uncharacterized protein n=1 Tax=Lactuca saligna TaxID=75948 RepID=A0AA35ZB98_LACSI|nr:unnamed protein product [Lactuca saligna]